ncbi:alpha/beta hydrolase [Variovorax sp. PCZ-1]|uniref:esterase/lipase family protein n=1 Tax=Variovorax sp. PCZ-1 TaxID=2835533 RepID=UPI001BD04EFC|nr:alpha/beta hydrolase [Variovorax sp. PCZ-1]MBS7807756.1 alpha/beta hydrolase [Variovorax sp. PCZ-1]
MPSTPYSAHSELNTLRGTSALAIQAVQGITDVVEEMHGAISGLALPIKSKDAKPKKTRGITGMVYRSVRGITGVVGWGVNRALDAAELPLVSQALAPAAKQLASKLKLKSAEPYRETVRSAVNGVLGDSLAATTNPLAIQMQFRQQGRALESASKTNGKLLILVHGLCMNDLQWHRDGHDHGAMLAGELGYEPIYLHYNTGRMIHENGADFAELLENTLNNWPVAITELVIIGHSMGGLVIRSACHHALKADHAWVKKLSKLITLGSPHAGAPLERAGRGVDEVLGVSPYTAPFAKLGLVRSAGIMNLRDGAVTPAGELPAWPKHVRLYALACTKQKAPAPEKKTDLAAPLKRLLGDGLVPVKSALAQEDKPKLGLPLKLPASRQAVVYEMDHFQMLGSKAVAKHLLRWLKK